MRIRFAVRPLPNVPHVDANNSIRTIVHRVSGDVLCLMDAESLKEIGIETIGQRLAILKAVYQLKLAQQIPIDSDHYVPPCTFLLVHCKCSG